MEQRVILFVCTGNTCRSPMAQGLMAKKLAAQPCWKVVSAGVAASVASAESRDTAALLAERGASLHKFRSRQVNEAMLRQATAVFCMTAGHRDLLLEDFPQFSEKYYLVGDFSSENPGGDVPDPIGMGANAYAKVADAIEDALPGMMRYLQAQPPCASA